ncbi:MAG: thioredoxin fold domain-containing protein [Alphaproteobacteria bacterium]
MIRVLLTGLFLLSFALPASAQSASEASPELPAPIQELVNQGAQIRYLGREHGFESWLTIKNGQEQYFYVLPDHSAFVMGLLFDNKGKLVTIDQVKNIQAKDDTLLDSIASGFGESTNPLSNLSDKEFKSPADQMFFEVENSNWIVLGGAEAPALYAFIDPQCPHCHEFINKLRKDYLEKGVIQLRVVPVGFRDETAAQAAYLLAAPDPQARLLRHLDGDEKALPAKSDLNQQGVQRNLAIMQSWNFTATPMIVYQSKSGEVKLVRGQPKNIPELIADLK